MPFNSKYGLRDAICSQANRQALMRAPLCGLTGSVTYVNIPAGKDQYGVFYVHPSTLGRYSTKEGSSDFERKFNIHIEADVDGKVMDAVDKNKVKPTAGSQPPGLKPISGLVYRQNQCRFHCYRPDRYPALKLPEPSAQ